MSVARYERSVTRAVKTALGWQTKPESRRRVQIDDGQEWPQGGNRSVLGGTQRVACGCGDTSFILFDLIEKAVTGPKGTWSFIQTKRPGETPAFSISSMPAWPLSDDFPPLAARHSLPPFFRPFGNTGRACQGWSGPKISSIERRTTPDC